EIRVPGNQLLTIERPMDPSDKFRFPRQWNYFQTTHGTEGQNVGTPLTQWPLLRPSQVEELRALKFYTVEQIAFASDQQLAPTGALAGLQGFCFRERAPLHLESAKDNAFAAKQAGEIRLRDEQIAQMRKDLEALKALMPNQAQPPREVLHAKKAG